MSMPVEWGMKIGDEGRSRNASVWTSASTSSTRSLNKQGQRGEFFVHWFTSVLADRVLFVRQCSFYLREVRAFSFVTFLEVSAVLLLVVSPPVAVELQQDPLEHAKRATHSSQIWTGVDESHRGQCVKSIGVATHYTSIEHQIASITKKHIDQRRWENGTHMEWPMWGRNFGRPCSSRTFGWLEKV